MKFDITTVLLLAIAGYVVYHFVLRENMTNPQTVTTAVMVVVGIVLLGVGYMYLS